MTDIIASPAVKEAVKVVMEQQERLGDEAAAEARESQPIRTSVLRAAQLAAEAEDHARGRQHVKGKLTARERLDLLLDTGSFEEIGRFRGGDINGGRAGSAVITGFGEVFGRKVAVYAQDFSVKGGTLGVAEGRKICHLMDKALDLKVPIIALIDSGGARIQEGVAALTEYGHLFRKTCDASGFVPQLSLILGPCAGRDLELFNGKIKTFVFTRESPCQPNALTEYISLDFNKDILPQIMEVLYQKKIQSLLVEGGSILLQSFIDSGLWDEAFIEKAPLRLNNGIQAPSIQKKHFKLNKIYFGREIMHAVHSQIQR